MESGELLKIPAYRASILLGGIEKREGDIEETINQFIISSHSLSP